MRGVVGRERMPKPMLTLTRGADRIDEALDLVLGGDGVRVDHVRAGGEVHLGALDRAFDPLDRDRVRAGVDDEAGIALRLDGRLDLLGGLGGSISSLPRMWPQRLGLT